MLTGVLIKAIMCEKTWDSIICLLPLEVSAILINITDLADENFAKNAYYSQSFKSFANANEQTAFSKKNLEQMRRTASANM